MEKKSLPKKEVTLSINIPIEMKECFTEWCSAKKVSRSEVLREYIRQCISQDCRIYDSGILPLSSETEEGETDGI